MIKKLIILLFIVMLSNQVSGCALFWVGAGAAGGAGAVIWSKGKLTEELRVSVSRLHDAAIHGLKELRLPFIVDKTDVTTAKIESEYADGKHVWIDIESISEEMTRIEVRVGITGDTTRSRTILDNIHKHL